MRTCSPVDSAVTVRPSAVPVNGDESQARGAHVPAEGEGAAPLRRYECQVVGQGVEDDCDGLVEHLPGDRVMSAGSKGVEPGPSELRRPHIGELAELAVLESQILVDINGPFAVERLDVQRVAFIRGRGTRRDLDITVSACPAEEKLRAVDGEGFGSQDVGGVEQEAVHVRLGQGGAHQGGHAIGQLRLRVPGAVHVSSPSVALPTGSPQHRAPYRGFVRAGLPMGSTYRRASCSGWRIRPVIYAPPDAQPTQFRAWLWPSSSRLRP